MALEDTRGCSEVAAARMAGRSDRSSGMSSCVWDGGAEVRRECNRPGMDG